MIAHWADEVNAINNKAAINKFLRDCLNFIFMNYYIENYCQMKHFGGEWNIVFNDKRLKYGEKRRIINVMDNFKQSLNVFNYKNFKVI